MTRSRLLIIDGTSGVWKEDLLDYASTLASAVVVQKVTTRSPQIGEDFSHRDLEHVDRGTFDKVSPKYRYEYSGELYGVTTAGLDEALENYATVFVIIRNFEVIQQLKRDYARCRPTSLFVYADSSVVSRKVASTGSPAPRDAMRQAFRDYLRNPHSYDEIVVNGGTSDDFYRLLDVQVRKVSLKQSGWHAQNPTDRAHIVIATTLALRRGIQIVLGALTAIGLAIAVNLITMDSLDAGHALGLGLACSLAVLSLLLQLLLIFAWRELD